MKKRKRLNIPKYNRQCCANQEQWKEHWKVIKWHPLTWLIIMIAVAYIFEL